MKKEDVYARMMHSPDDPERAAARAALREAWNQLLPLHRALIDASRAEYEAGGAEVRGPFHLLQLLQEEPHFAWLRPLTSVIADLDSMARTDFTTSDVDAMRKRIEWLFTSDGDPEFAPRYFAVLQRDFDVAIGHAEVRKIIARLTRD